MSEFGPVVGGHLRSLESYTQRRLQLAGGSLGGDDSSGQGLVDLLKTLYLQPLDTLTAQFAQTGRQLVSFANYDYAGLRAGPPHQRGRLQCDHDRWHRRRRLTSRRR